MSERGGDIVTLGLPTDGRMISDPQVLPGGRAILHTEGGADKPDNLQIYDLQNDTSKRLLPARRGSISRAGISLDQRRHSMGCHVRVDRMEVRGTPTPVLEGIRETWAWPGQSVWCQRNRSCHRRATWSARLHT